MTASELFEKEVISICDGARIGDITDLEISENGNITAIIIPGRLRFFGLLGRGKKSVIPWGCVRVIGEETVLVDIEIIVENTTNQKGYFQQ